MELDDIYPIRDSAGSKEEPLDSYLSRIKKILPNIPDDVLEQWFFDNPQVINDWDWLDYRSCKFEKGIITNDELDRLDFAETSVPVLIENNRTMGFSAHMQKIAKYFAQYGTWPRPVIFLASIKATTNPPEWLKGRALPYLVEGHRRVAAYFLLKQQSYLKNRHQIWDIHA